MKMILAILALAAVAAAQVDTMVATEDHHAAAQFLIQAKGANACSDLADADIADINQQVSDSQDVMNALSDGSECAAKGQVAVSSAQDSLDAANDAKSDADNELDAANNASVDFPSYAYNSLSEGDCTPFASSDAYQSASKRVSDAETQQSNAQDQVDAAEAAYDSAVNEAARQKKECECAAKDAHDNAWQGVQDQKAAQKNTWDKAHNLKCVLNDESPCAVVAVPEVEDRPLIAEAAAVECDAGAAIAPSPPAVGMSSVEYGNYNYAVMDGTNPDDSSAGCQQDWLAMPDGWELVPYSDDVDVNVVRTHVWGTHVVVFSNGDGYGSKNYSPGKWEYDGSNMLEQDNGKYKPKYCHLRILIQAAK